MKFKTTPSLVEKQKSYWNEDFFMPGDIISDLFEVPTSEILNEDQEVLESYAKSKEDQKIVSSFEKALLDGKPLPPLFIDKNNHLIDGYHRLLAITQLGIKVVPVIQLNRSCR